MKLQRRTILEVIRYLKSLLTPRALHPTQIGDRMGVHPARPAFGVDGEAIPSSKSMRSAGVSFFCGYLSYSGNPKNLTRIGVRRLRRDGFGIVSIFETTADRALKGRAAGEIDAISALKQLVDLGAPAHAPILFAVDFDARPTQIYDYFSGVRGVLKKSSVKGCYGSYRVIKFLLDKGLIDYAFQAYAWSGGARDHRAQLYQFSNGHRIGGIEVDFDRAYAADYGQWRW